MIIEILEILTNITQLIFIIASVTVWFLIGAWVSLGNFHIKNFYFKYIKNDNSK